MGLRCRIFWSDDKTWYKGVISQHDASNGKHLIEYEDGDTEWLDLCQERFELLQKPGGATDHMHYCSWHLVFMWMSKRVPADMLVHRAVCRRWRQSQAGKEAPEADGQAQSYSLI